MRGGESWSSGTTRTELPRTDMRQHGRRPCRHSLGAGTERRDCICDAVKPGLRFRAFPLLRSSARLSPTSSLAIRKGDYLRVPRRRRAGYLKCAAALAMISPALRAKPLSSTGATSALDFNERFAGPCRSSERACRFFFSPMNDSATCFIDPNAAPELSFHVPLSRSMQWTCQFEHSSKSTIGPRLGRKILRIWRQHSRPH